MSPTALPSLSYTPPLLLGYDAAAGVVPKARPMAEFRALMAVLARPPAEAGFPAASPPKLIMVDEFWLMAGAPPVFGFAGKRVRRYPDPRSHWQLLVQGCSLQVQGFFEALFGGVLDAALGCRAADTFSLVEEGDAALLMGWQSTLERRDELHELFVGQFPQLQFALSER